PPFFLMTDEFRIYCDEILGSSPRMTKNASRGMAQGLENSRIFVIASEAKQFLGILDLFLEILNSSLGILDLYLRILDFCSLLGWINLAYKFYKGYALNL
ncbi:MAG: hypothetical protein SO164_03745, partial [Campylobacter sp.]|nr:hypothetical protein [Campylobacter sp.]